MQPVSRPHGAVEVDVARRYRACVRESTSFGAAVIELKTPDQIALMREAGRVVANALHAVREAAVQGVTLLQLDEIATQVIVDAGAVPVFRDYHPHFAPVPFPGTICASVNDAIVHGIPGDLVLADGDLLSVDCGANLDGWVGDSAFSMQIGGTGPAVDKQLIEDTRTALKLGIAQAVPGNRMGDIAHAIGSFARGKGYGMPEGWGGHGIGRVMHEDPPVPNEGIKGKGMKLKAGLVICIEPMLHLGDDEYTIDSDGWTVRTSDGQRAAHEEHTLAITKNGPVILTHR
jgi:methionyl aminopeptidase